MYPIMLRLSRWMAYIGGLTLSVLIIMTCISIVGRTLSGVLNSDLVQSTTPDLANALLALGIGPIKGDFELVEAGMAFTIFAFLPICQIRSGHASVDVFVSMMSERANKIFRMIAEVLFALVLIVITVQLFNGMQSKMASGQTTFLIEFPIWWSYAFSLVGSVIASIASIYVAFERIREMMTGHTVLPEAGAEH